LVQVLSKHASRLSQLAIVDWLWRPLQCFKQGLSSLGVWHYDLDAMPAEHAKLQTASYGAGQAKPKTASTKNLTSNLFFPPKSV